MRRNEIDWIRNIAILMLFPYHTAVIFDGMGDFFVKASDPHHFATIFIASTFFWYMPLLFFLAGASTYHALGKRSTKEYVKERVIKLLVPYLIGILTVVPSQVYYALKWRGIEVGNIFEFYGTFLFKFTDFKGVDGAFTPAHLWFILFLFIISLIAIPILRWVNTKKGLTFIGKMKKRFLNVKGFAFTYLIFMVAEIIPRLGDKSIIQNLLLFVFGYICYSDEEFLDKIDAKKHKALIISIIGVAFSVLVYNNALKILSPRLSVVILVICTNAVVLPVIISIVGYGRKFLIRDTKILRRLNKNSFYIYILHQPFLVTLAYYIVPLEIAGYMKVVLILITSFIITIVACYLLKVIKWCVAKTINSTRSYV